MNFFLNLAVLGCIFAVLAVSLNISLGTCGVVTIAPAGFMGLGAYTTGIMTTKHDTPLLWSVAVGVAISAVVALVLVPAILRIKGLLQVIVTFAFMLVIGTIFLNLDDLTGGPAGIAGIPQLSVGGWTAQTNAQYFVVYSIMVVCIALGYAKLIRSRLGVVMRAARDNAQACRAAGKPATALLTLGFVLGAGLAAVAGSMYASFIGYIDPASFSLEQSFLIVAMVVLGGSGSAAGSVLGAVLIYSIPQLISQFDLPSATGGALVDLIYGAIIVAIVRLRPQGLLAEAGWRGLARQVRRIGDREPSQLVVRHASAGQRRVDTVKEPTVR